MDPETSSPESVAKKRPVVLKKQSSASVIGSGKDSSLRGNPPNNKNSNKIFQIAFMSAQPLGSARELDDEEDAGRKFHFPMKPGDLLEPTYFNRKN